ncbi:hypothetical protein BA768_01100 [Chryseobacterium sp. CBo1]|uniref:hypothetical protein n=1 Tax=Chryseobacterium sp. CBo1 TaxID=1869230 RepID=UPI000810D34C|nr:hypothetical protein [Chryseobacterium sp. CBo1]OCK53181.1 hypothetical protein BA768_01100 [Chryseobacterium sp. CBo1]
MKQKIRRLKDILFLSFLFSLTLSSCRQDEINQTEAEKNSTTSSFGIFESKNNKNAKNASTTSDAYAFRLLYFTYYIDHPEEAVDFKDLTLPYIDFSYSSQVFYDEDGTRKTLFPIIVDNQVRNVVVASVTNENDMVSWYIPEYDKDVETAILSFSDRRGTSENPHEIEEVIINVPPKKNHYLAPFEPTIPGMPLPPIGGCTTYNNCGGGGGGGGGISTPPVSTSQPPPPPKTPVDIKKFLSCLNINQPANLKVYAQTMASSPPGHAFISITQGSNVMVFGFYPQSGFPSNINGPSTFADDSGHAYTHSWNIGTISPTQLQLIIAQAHLYSTYNYDLGFSNCADFALSAISLAGVNTNNNGIDTPDTVSSLIGGLPQPGTAPTSNRTCN